MDIYPTLPRKPFLLAAEGLTRSFDGFKAINDLNFYLDEGELRTVIGPNGAGKTTFLDLITGRTKPDVGTLKWDDGQHDLLKMSEYEIYRLGIGRKFQTPTVYNDHTVTENLILSLAGSRGIWHSLFGKVTPAQRERIAEILSTIKLTDHAHRKAGILAHGQKQWLEIGMLLAQDARLLLVDEPAAGMQRNAGQPLRRRPAHQLPVGPAQAAQRAAFDVHPVQRLLGRAPQGAFAHLVLVVRQQEFHGPTHSNGPVRTNGPPW